MKSPDRAECAAVLAQIQAYLDGDLDTVGCEVIEHHCAGCEECSAVVHGLRQTIGLCREAGRAPLPEAIRDRAREQMKRLLASARMC